MAGPGAKPVAASIPRVRLDKWLWMARLCKTRAVAADLISLGQVRVNGHRVTKPGHAIAVQDVLTLAVGGKIRLIRITAFGLRRGPVSEAQMLYIDVDAAPTPLE